MRENYPFSEEPNSFCIYYTNGSLVQSSDSCKDAMGNHLHHICVLGDCLIQIIKRCWEMERNYQSSAEAHCQSSYSCRNASGGLLSRYVLQVPRCSIFSIIYFCFLLPCVGFSPSSLFGNDYVKTRTAGWICRQGSVLLAFASGGTLDMKQYLFEHSSCFVADLLGASAKNANNYSKLNPNFLPKHV